MCLWSCNTSSDYYDISSLKEPLIVINSRLIARQSPRVSVSKIWGSTAKFPTEIFYRDADVELFEEGKSVGKLFLKDSLYINPSYIIKANTQYTIKASVQGAKSVESESVLIPADVSILSTSYEINPTVKATNSYFNFPCLVTTTFKKDIEVAGYGIQILGFNKEEQQLYSDNENLESNSQTIAKSPCLFAGNCVDVGLDGTIGELTYRGYSSYVSKCLDSSEKNIKIMTSLESYGLAHANRYPPYSPAPQSRKITKLIVTVTAISKEGLELSRTTKVMEGFSAALSEPYPTYSNIKGGLGIVIGYNVAYKVLTIK